MDINIRKEKNNMSIGYKLIKLFSKDEKKKVTTDVKPVDDFKETLKNDNFLKQPIDNVNIMNKSIVIDVDRKELKRAISEFKSARTLLKKALMRTNHTGLGNALYELDIIISDLKRKVK